MIATVAYPLTTNAAAKRCTARAHGIEKTKARQQFDGEYTPARERRNGAAPAQCRPAPSQFGTNDHASFWNGPRLKPAFAAQVLGQAMGLNQAPDASAQAAYRGFAAQRPALLNEKL
jgi:hypothetical protein